MAQSEGCVEEDVDQALDELTQEVVDRLARNEYRHMRAAVVCRMVDLHRRWLTALKDDPKVRLRDMPQGVAGEVHAGIAQKLHQLGADLLSLDRNLKQKKDSS